MNMKWIFPCILLAVAGCKTAVTPQALVAENVDATRATIRSEIKDPERRTAMLAVVEAFDKDMQAIGQEARGLREKITAAEADYDTPRAQLQDLYDGLGRQLQRVCDTAQEHSLALRRQCSAAEWKILLARQNENAKLKCF